MDKPADTGPDDGELPVGSYNMSEVRSVRPRRWSPIAGLLFAVAIGAVMAGLMAMHGLQASTGPTDMSGIPSAPMHMASGSMTEHGVEPARHRPSPSKPAHDHPGGQVCLGMLLLGAVTALLVLTGYQRSSQWLGTAGHTISRLRHRRCGRPPPSILQLSVLRL